MSWREKEDVWSALKARSTKLITVAWDAWRFTGRGTHTFSAWAKGAKSLWLASMRNERLQDLQVRSSAEGKVDTEADMLSGISRKRNAHSSHYWFSEFCNSQCSSHFAAPFIGVRAKTSIAESFRKKSRTISGPKKTPCKQDEVWWVRKRRQGESIPKPSHLRSQLHKEELQLDAQWSLGTCANDPSAGSPTETLLRLLLPLSVKIHQTFRSNIQELKIAAVRIIHRDTQSVGATGGVYKGQGRVQCTLMTHTY